MTKQSNKKKHKKSIKMLRPICLQTKESIKTTTTTNLWSCNISGKDL